MLPIDDATLQRIRALLRPDFLGYLRAPEVIDDARTMLPPRAADGERCVYWARNGQSGADADVRWPLVYDAKSAYWYPDGAAEEMVRLITPNFAPGALSVFVNSLTPLIIVPLLGDYHVEVRAFATVLVAANANVLITPGRNGAVVGAAGFAQRNLPTNVPNDLHWEQDFTGDAAGDSHDVMVWTDNASGAGNTTFGYRRIAVRPVRVR